MPELPEVETVRKTLQNSIAGLKINSVIVRYPNIIEMPSLEEFTLKIKNQTINEMKRRGKWLIFDLDDYYLFSHLRMEGKYFLKDTKSEYNKHDHVIFNLSNNQDLRYNDTRKFGRMLLVKKEEANNSRPLNELGLEPFDTSLTRTYLKNSFSKKRLSIKTVLLDQTIVVGIGNIYANEILFQSKIDPFKRACDLTDKEIDTLIKETQDILRKAITYGGTTIKSYVSSEGVHGRFQQNLFVQGRSGLPCLVCKTLIEKDKINGRSVYYCPKCQKSRNV